VSDIHVIRRIAERGLQRAQEDLDSEYVDIFQHILDEIERMENEDVFS
jgi:uncharacterized membrane protein YqiK